ncbi:UV radiation resistance-associated gene protein isoform X2 [Iris pallida]|uniref:UV radiation resistance-associated gene protein isoform X2 n=1 Tax=Iris pallida TaxID=29817 RepID=A0AAX6ELF6_IRIPA|nr:UV radiation resistance-associated gene protein isoform X2 [Iris pallida]
MDSIPTSACDPSAAPSSSEVVVGVESPKVVEWEELQQELARLWSLSSTLAKARERKESLSRKIEDFVKVREESLRQSNELENMREKLEARKFAMGDMSMSTKEILEDVKSQRERTCVSARMLLVAGQNLSAAHQQLQEANKLLAGKRGHGNLRNLQKMLRMRQQYMISQVSTLYPVKASNESKEKLDSRDGDSAVLSTANMSKPQQTASLTILGLQLTALHLKKMSIFSNKSEVQMSAAVLGYVAHAVLLIASYLDVRLRYPLRFGGSRSYIHDYAPSIDSASSASAPNAIIDTSSKSTEFPLFLEGQDATRAAYAIFLLNKDLEQLLNYIGAESLGPRHVLPNLKELMRIIQSPEYIDN